MTQQRHTGFSDTGRKDNDDGPIAIRKGNRDLRRIIVADDEERRLRSGVQTAKKFTGDRFEPFTSAKAANRIGITIHLLHLILNGIYIDAGAEVCDNPWECEEPEFEGVHWTICASFVLLCLSFAEFYYLFTRFRTCRIGVARNGYVLVIWYPNIFEKTLLCLYSPIHSVLWIMLSGWSILPIAFVMSIVWLQTRVLLRKYEILTMKKDFIQVLD